MAPEPSLIDGLLGAYYSGMPWTEISKRYGIPPRTLRDTMKRALPAMPGDLAPINPGQLQYLGGAQAIDWADDHGDLVLQIHARARQCDWNAQSGTVVLLAMAWQVRAELAAQTGGAAPTMRTALYRMMARYAVTKDAYVPLIAQTAQARHDGVLPRDLWADSEPSSIEAPGWCELGDALDFGHPARPSDPLARTGHVFGVVTETRGAAPAIAGAVRQRLGFTIPVWFTGGTGSMPRRLYIEEQMHKWAKRTDAEPHLLVISDYDPTGLIIANGIADEVRDVDVQRIGIWPQQSPSPAALPKEYSENATHNKSQVWLDAVAVHGSDEHQAEAVDYAGWTGHIVAAIEEHIDLEDAYDEHGPEWDDGDRLMDALDELLTECDHDPVRVLERLDLA